MQSDQVLKRITPTRITKRRFHRLFNGYLVTLTTFAVTVLIVIKLSVFNEDEDPTNPHAIWIGVGKRLLDSHAYDKTLSDGLLHFWKSEDVSSLIDLGAGIGPYAKDAMAAGILTSCYNRDPKTFETSDGHCAVVDLTKPIHFAKHDWVISLEAGEHIPKEFEDVFIGNLDRVNRKGMVISWAIEREIGYGNVNSRSNKYIIEKIEKLGYQADMEAQNVLRAAARNLYFNDTIMVFRSTKIRPKGLLGFLFR